MTDKIKVYGYLRVSSDGQVTSGNGLNGQRGAIEDYAKKNNFHIEKFYVDDGVSGKLASRKGLNGLIDDLKKSNKDKKNPKIKYVLVDDIDRIARDSLVRLTKKAEIEAIGAAIISIKRGVDFGDSPESHLSENITMATKQYERENNARRVVSRQSQRLKDGYWCFNLPIGYKFIKNPNGGGKIVVPDEPTFSIVSQGLKLLANGTLPTQASLIKYLNERGVKTHSGGPVNDKFMSRLINKGRLPLYAGLIDFPEWGINEVKGKHQAAITKEEYYKIATKFNMRTFYKDCTPNDISNELQLRRILRCGCCGGLLSGSTSKGKGGQYFYYYCFNKNCPCYRTSYNSKKINTEIEKFLGMLTLDEDYMNGFKVIVDAIWKEKENIQEGGLKLKEKRIKEIDKEISDKVEKITETKSDVVYKVLEEKIESLNEEKIRLQSEILSLKGGSIDNYLNEFDALKTVIQSPLNVWKQADLELKRLLISNIFNNSLSYSEENGLRTPEIPLVYAKNSKLFDRLNGDNNNSLRTPFTLDENWIKKNKSFILG